MADRPNIPFLQPPDETARRQFEEFLRYRGLPPPQQQPQIPPAVPMNPTFPPQPVPQPGREKIIQALLMQLMAQKGRA